MITGASVLREEYEWAISVLAEEGGFVQVTATISDPGGERINISQTVSSSRAGDVGEALLIVARTVLVGDRE